MNKFYLFLSAAILVFFSGCNSTTALNHFEKDPQSANAIQYTRKSDLIYKKEINSMIFATYLNNINDKYNNNTIESFVVGTHIVDKNDHNFIKNGYKIFLNEKSAKNIIDLDKKSDLVKSIPLRNSWANYYLIQFVSDKNRELTLKFNHPIYGQTQLKFQK